MTTSSGGKLVVRLRDGGGDKTTLQLNGKLVRACPPPSPLFRSRVESGKFCSTRKFSAFIES